ncbi:MAG: D-alanine--D-alanine ligase [Fusobacteriaceae bacterium]|jgi:D-alanine-D-alanine ligase|nr:D-alanine--D-alanine ligase [Fusobacteriaceae bacterium]MBP9596217.1 D-alanine--D-alanine ligase [Fusobacteriaceae bacterium]MBU9918107.1 D-alanine--D-alanine ligase [Fusobacteriaceae bacterium]
MKIAVLMGGISSEKEVSLRTGAAITAALQRKGYDAFSLVLDKDNFVTALTNTEFDLAYVALHGEFGEDGRVQAFLDILGKKYTGSGYVESGISMNKTLTKKILDSYGVLSPKTYEKVEDIEKYPVVIKPTTEGSSVGLYICQNEAEARNAVEALEGKEILIEDFIKGEELTVGVLNGEALGVLRIKPISGVYDYESKYTKGMTEYEFPAQISEASYDEAMKISAKVHKELNLKGATRSDFILRGEELFFLEVNTSPGMTETSLLPKIATLKNIDFDTLVEKIVCSVEK